MAVFVVAGYDIIGSRDYEGKRPRFDQGRVYRDGERIQSTGIERESEMGLGCMVMQHFA